jgi:hypothetical protein
MSKYRLVYADYPRGEVYRSRLFFDLDQAVALAEAAAKTEGKDIEVELVEPVYSTSWSSVLHQRPSPSPSSSGRAP